MNERLLKLAKESGISFGGHPMNSLNVYQSELQKFAELIVRECADRSRELGNPELGQGITKHFGVE